MSKATQQKATLFAKFSSSDVSDALGTLNIVNHLPRITLKTSNNESRICGPAHTVKFVRKHEQAQTQAVHHVDCAERGSVIVISTPFGTENAVWGGIMSTRAKILDVAGVVIEGNCRDLNEIRDIGVPVFASGTSTLGAGMFVKVSSVNEPITIARESQWPVTVNPGDIIVADRDGCVCVPLDKAEEVAKLCEKMSEIDSKCILDIQNGFGIKETFHKYRS